MRSTRGPPIRPKPRRAPEAAASQRGDHTHQQKPEKTFMAAPLYGFELRLDVPGSARRRCLLPLPGPMARIEARSRECYADLAQRPGAARLFLPAGRKHSVAEPTKPSRKQPPECARVEHGRNVEDPRLTSRCWPQHRPLPRTEHPVAKWRCHGHANWPNGPRDHVALPKPAYRPFCLQKLPCQKPAAKEGPCGLKGSACAWRPMAGSPRMPRLAINLAVAPSPWRGGAEQPLRRPTNLQQALNGRRSRCLFCCRCR